MTVTILQSISNQTPCPTTPGGPNKNLTVPSFRPTNATSAPLYRALGSALPNGCLFRASCSVSRITIFKRMSWSALYGTGGSCAADEDRCWLRGDGWGDGDDGVLGDVFADGF